MRADRLLKTLESLQRRISERFPGSGLSKVTAEVQEAGVGVVQLGEKLRRPYWALRLMTVTFTLILLGITVWVVVFSIRHLPSGESGLVDLLQGVESATNDLIFVALAILFFFTLESRIKRKAALKSLHRLRSLAHVVDMHQLTKDPSTLHNGSRATAATPKRNMSAYDLTRYLDYCSELLAIISKLAALHVQNFQDSQVLDTVNDVENLSQGLSGKIWQKIMILDMASQRATAGETSSVSSGASTRPGYPE